jgi:hypothetical protein
MRELKALEDQLNEPHTAVFEVKRAELGEQFEMLTDKIKELQTAIAYGREDS